MRLRIVLPLCFICLFILAHGVLMAQDTRPNIVWISIEDTSPDFIGCYGNRQSKTPHIDALAADGVKFTNAYSTNTVCAPSRHTIITGIHTSSDGCGNHRSTMKIPGYVKGFASYLKASGYFTSNNAKTDYNMAGVDQFIEQNWTMQGNDADFTKRADKDQPFFSVYNISYSHQSVTSVNTNKWFEAQQATLLSPKEIIQAATLEVPPFYINNDNNRRNMARLYNAMYITDKKVGQIIDHIKKSNEWDNTIVFFFGDHGQGMPRFKTNASRLGSQVPFIVRVPEKYRSLLGSSESKSSDELISFEDLAPTMIALTTGLQKPDYMRGRIFMGPLKEPEPAYLLCSRDNTDEVIDMGRTLIKGHYTYTRIYYPCKPVLQQHNYAGQSEMIMEMREDYKAGRMNTLQASLFEPRFADYLYDRRNDQWETRNLAADPTYATILKDMKAGMKQALETYNDIGFLPEAVLAQVDMYDTILSWKQQHYKMDKYYEVAEMAGRGKSFLKKQLACMQDRDSVVRYWAAVGLRCQRKEDLQKAAIAQLFISEKSTLVKIELADLLYIKFGDSAGLDWLTDFIAATPNGYLGWQAAAKLENYVLPVSYMPRIEALFRTVPPRHAGQPNYALRAALGTILKKNINEK